MPFVPVAGLRCQQRPQPIQVFAALHAPHDFAQRRAVFDGGWQNHLHRVGHHHAAAVQALEDELLAVVDQKGQAPIDETLAAGSEIAGAVGHLVDAQGAHDGFVLSLKLTLP